MRAVLTFVIAVNSTLFLSCTKNKINDSPVAGLDTLPVVENQPTASLLTDMSLSAVYTKRNWQGVPTVEITNERHLVVAWYSGGKGEGPGNYVTVAESLDGGTSWRKNALIVAPPDSSYRIFDPALWKDNMGLVHLFWAQSRGWWDGKGGVWSCLLDFSADTIKPGKPKFLADGVMINKPVYQSSEGKTMLMPISIWRHAPTPAVNSGAYVAYASYYAERDNFLIAKNKKIFDDKIRFVDEHQIVATGTGTFLCLFRTLKGIYYSTSVDNGENWTTAEPFTVVSPIAASRFHIQRLKSGNLLLIVNSSSTRTNLKGFLSKNGGKTWPYAILIDSRKNVSYPDACEGPNGTLFVVYDRNRSLDKEINLAKFNEQDFFKKNAKAIISIIDK
ncbi:sialidase family protein [Chitinophaga eiseniae]|uniref:Exo-alpha-sialidase n=1 Tax=Chitinophaga eiseniae TaxID=634771 RepID=A0A847SFR2_9BACT|nr:sialidase family protein [Chitinophaga eiseniae]NLR78593.1 exo-alpha-sialidase [Chitinophaga eiseniae]